MAGGFLAARFTGEHGTGHGGTTTWECLLVRMLKAGQRYFMSSTATVLHTSFDEDRRQVSCILYKLGPWRIRKSVLAACLATCARSAGQLGNVVRPACLLHSRRCSVVPFASVMKANMPCLREGMLFCAAMNAVLLNKGLAEFEAMTPVCTEHDAQAWA